MNVLVFLFILSFKVESGAGAARCSLEAQLATVVTADADRRAGSSAWFSTKRAVGWNKALALRSLSSG